MEFIEIRTQPEMEEAFGILRELIPELDKEAFFLNHIIMTCLKIIKYLAFEGFTACR